MVTALGRSDPSVTIAAALTTAKNNWNIIQESTWTTQSTVGEIDWDGSPTQKTTLGSATDVTFTGTVAANEGRTVLVEVTHATNDLTILAANRGSDATRWETLRDELESEGSAYVVVFTTNSAGVPKYAGAYSA